MTGPIPEMLTEFVKFDNDNFRVCLLKGEGMLDAFFASFAPVDIPLVVRDTDENFFHLSLDCTCMPSRHQIARGRRGDGIKSRPSLSPYNTSVVRTATPGTACHASHEHINAKSHIQLGKAIACYRASGDARTRRLSH